MRQANVTEKLIGKYLARDIYDDMGRLLLGKEIELSDVLIKKLLDAEVYFVYIEDQLSEGIEVKGLIEDTKMLGSINKVKNILQNVTVEKKDAAAMIREEDLEAVDSVIKDLIESLEENPDALYTVVDLMGADMYTYKHSVNVAILSILTSRSLGYDYHLTKHIAMGALLHDIGKALVKGDLIQKQDKLTDEEFEEVKKHVEYGYDLVKDNISLSGYTKQIVRLHHEKRDGSGYPLGLKETEIPDFVRIITICDMFDAMTSNRVYRKSMPVYQAIEILMADSVFKLDAIILDFFLKNICVYPPGSGVRLCDGREGLVVQYNKYSPTRPIIRVFKSEEGYSEVSEINLEKNLVLFIEETISSDDFDLKYSL
jgi:putative nucleotidyltransferase with HDIG domain